MADTVTPLTAIQCVSTGGATNGLITPIRVVMDGTPSDQEIVAADSRHHIAVVGMCISNQSGTPTITWKSGSTELFTQAYPVSLSVTWNRDLLRIGAPLFLTNINEALVANASAAISFLLYTMKVRRLDMRPFL